MTTAYENPVLDPAQSDWPCVRRTLADTRLQTMRQSARRRLVETAELYVQRLTELGRRSGLLTEPHTLLSGDVDGGALVMTGHQPVIFHSGLTFKYATTEEFASRHNAACVAVIIDTDEGDAGAYTFPDTTDPMKNSGVPQLTTRQASFGLAPALYASSRMKSASEIQAVALEAIGGLERSKCHEAASNLRRRADQYASIGTESMMEANLIVRRNANIGCRMLDLPLSGICRFPEVIQFFAEILARPFEFAQCYNETLAAFRAEQKIRNDANPFPSLQLENGRCELPFWSVDLKAGTRSTIVVTVKQNGRSIATSERILTELLPGNEAEAVFSLLVAGQQLIPRGALITAMLRLMFSDLFVHGTGGGRYDRYTDILVRRWWNVEPTPIAVASASRYLFHDERRDLAHVQRIADQLRDLQFNPQRYFGTGLFSAATEQSLRERIALKDEAVERLRTARESGHSAQTLGRELQRLTDDIKRTVASEFEPQLVRLREFDDETIATIQNRTWPWLYFPGPS